MKKLVRNEEGFTLIEIIAVLVILGIMAAVAIPKFADMQQEARNKAVEGAIAAIKSQATMDYAQYLLENDGDTSWEVTTTGSTYGDFQGGYVATSADGGVTVTVTSGPGWFAQVAASETSAAFSYR